MRLVDLDDLISIENVSAMLGVTNPTIRRMVERDELPEPHQVTARCVMFSRSAVRQAIACMADPMTAELMTQQAAAALMGVSVNRLIDMRAEGLGPTAYRHGRRGVRYRRAELLIFLQQSTDSDESRQSSESVAA